MGWGQALRGMAARRRAAGDPEGASPAPRRTIAAEGAEPVLPSPVDAGSRTYWVRGADAPLTLVEAEGAARPRPLRDRLRDLLADHERGRGRAGRPAGDPAFTEMLLVELMRGGQLARAFALLAPECQRRWGGEEAFAAAHPEGSQGRLLGARVAAVRHLEAWVDPRTQTRHPGAAELDVEYRVGPPAQPLVLRRTVHLVAVDGRWRSLCYPAAAAAAADAGQAAA